MKHLSIAVILALIGLGLNSCYKVHHNYIVKGEWYLNSLEIDGGSTNFMHGVLPGYSDPDGSINGYYRIYMLDNGLIRSEYFVDDTLNYFKTGVWDLQSYDSIYLNVDDYSNGTYYIELVNKNEMIMTSPKNNIKFFNIGEVQTVLRVSRNKPTSEDATTPWL